MTTGALVLAMLPGAVALAASPVPVIAVVLLLVSRRGLAPALAYSAALIGTTGLAAAVVGLLGSLLPEREGHGDDPVRGWITVASGLVLIAVAAVQWVRRRQPDGRPASLRWERVFDGVTPGHAIALGVGQIIATPKNLVLVVTAGLVLGEAAAGFGADVLAVVVFALVGSLGVLVPLVWRFAAPVRSQRVLDLARRWLLVHGAVLLAAVLAVVGVVLVLVGLGAAGVWSVEGTG